MIEDIFNNPDPKNAKQLEKILIKQFKKLGGDPRFKKLSDRLEALRDKAEQGLITSIEFVKELCKIAKETLQAEKELIEEIQEKSPKAALTELFLELKTDSTPAVVERIVGDIDAIFCKGFLGCIVWFPVKKSMTCRSYLNIFYSLVFLY